MNENRYQGKYKMGQSPNPSRLIKHNAESWIKVEKVLSESNGIAESAQIASIRKDQKTSHQNNRQDRRQTACTNQQYCQYAYQYRESGTSFQAL